LREKKAQRSSWEGDLFGTNTMWGKNSNTLLGARGEREGRIAFRLKRGGEFI